MTRERNPTATTLQKAYAVLDKYKIGRTFFVKTDQTDCQIAEPADGNDVAEEEGAGKAADAVEAVPEVPVKEVKPEAVVPAAAAAPVAAVAPVEDVVRKDVVEEVKPVEPVKSDAQPINEVKPTKTESPKSQWLVTWLRQISSLRWPTNPPSSPRSSGDRAFAICAPLCALFIFSVYNVKYILIKNNLYLFYLHFVHYLHLLCTVQLIYTL